MKKGMLLVESFLILVILSSAALALPPIEGRVFGIYPVSNEISFYKNVDDSGNDRGETLQVVAINGFKIYTEFTFEFTGDFNYGLAGEQDDHYIELSLVKRVIGPLSINYQRIYSTFELEPVNQIGLRLSL